MLLVQSRLPHLLLVLLLLLLPSLLLPLLLLPLFLVLGQVGRAVVGAAQGRQRLAALGQRGQLLQQDREPARGESS